MRALLSLPVRTYAPHYCSLVAVELVEDGAVADLAKLAVRCCFDRRVVWVVKHGCERRAVDVFPEGVRCRQSCQRRKRGVPADRVIGAWC